MSGPTHFVGAMILDRATGAPVGTAQIYVNIDLEPANQADVVAWAGRITDRAHRDGDLPTGQRYLLLSWQRLRSTS